MTNKLKRKNPIITMIGLLLFLGALLVGAYYVSQQESLGDTRSSAAEPSCSCAGKSGSLRIDCEKACKNSNIRYSVFNPSSSPRVYSVFNPSGAKAPTKQE